ncbi:MAG: hypothetical protein B6D58_10090 [candidate division Zixibacteria bacterium 4484_95]|nr:MAG: hypothetical protein B6D58_10090 [candidate division Zixibacteria bacterium 4484_95]RLB79987.1 MAG: hypothetical protein DRH24_11560 [Deltaproteobacteria bacterium]
MVFLLMSVVIVFLLRMIRIVLQKFRILISCFLNKGEPIISNYGSQGKSQVQPDGGEGHSV